ncbi:hypothetical protein [Bacillus sp. V59.32b]|uniref:hypothetical protein n=1 Tax=Bacillus sp. V59.32b TaxID=1758642 RepID=UPI0020B10EAE|nr:hypothetical protein [Bacillus sp. V59.32b]
MVKDLSELQKVLVRGQQLSMQGSDGRRKPDKKSVPFLIEARKGLKEYLNDDSENGTAWRFLSHAEETLLNYKEALHALERGIELSGKTKKDFKKIA